MSSPKPNNDHLYKIIRINEIMWLVFGGIAIILTVYSLVTASREQAIYFLALTFLSGLLYSFKRRQRIRYQKRETEIAEEQRKKK
ncbi:MAG: hypothetical protein ACJ76F_14270 [Bacteroidia bacterium]